MYWGGRGTVLRRDIATCVDMPLVRCMEENDYGGRLALIVRNSSELIHAAPVAHRLERVALLRPYDPVYLLTNFEYWRKEIHLNSYFALGALQRCLLTSIRSITLVDRLVIEKRFSLACRRSDPIIKRVTYWLLLRS